MGSDALTRLHQKAEGKQDDGIGDTLGSVGMPGCSIDKQYLSAYLRNRRVTRRESSGRRLLLAPPGSPRLLSPFVARVYLCDELLSVHRAPHDDEVPAHCGDQLLLRNTQLVIAVLSASEPWIFKVKLDGAGKAIRLHDGKKSG